MTEKLLADPFCHRLRIRFGPCWMAPTGQASIGAIADSAHVESAKYFVGKSFSPAILDENVAKPPDEGDITPGSNRMSAPSLFQIPRMGTVLAREEKAQLIVKQFFSERNFVLNHVSFVAFSPSRRT